jgi:RecB family exonuclease
VLDCNEGTLPKTSRADSFIPFDLRAALNLPNRHRKEAIYAHYLYRLLNRAEEVVLVYLKDDDEHEPSRYLKQLEHAFKPGGQALEVVHETVEAELPAPRPEIRDIEWTAFAESQARKWAASGMSPSALNTLMECPRNFYYTYIMKMREQDQVEETLSASQFGSVVHQIFEWGLADAKDRPVTVNDLQSILAELEPLLDRAVAQWYNPELMAVGENRIARKLAEETARALVEQEIQELQSGAQRTLRGLEINLRAQIGDLAFRGQADRVDVEGGVPVVIDYKSGKVEPGDVRLSANWEEQLSAGKRPKALQLLVYAAIALRGMNANGTLPEDGAQRRDAPEFVRAGIRSGRRASSGLLELDWDGQREVSLEQSERFLDWVAAQLEALYLGERAIAHNEEQRFCPYCVALDPQADYF